MKFGKLVKRGMICVMLLLCVATAFPVLFMMIDITVYGYDDSGLKKLISALE